MIVVTGGAGFIGSALIWELNQKGVNNILVVDHLGTSDKWRNLAPLRFLDYIEKDQFVEALQSESMPDNISTIIHLGACTSTLEQDATYIMMNNFKYSQAIASYCLQRRVRLIYASAASTYGSGEHGFGDGTDKLELLRPLSVFAYSKQLFDLWCHRNGFFRHIVGLKFANVFGPNEYHKGPMRSIVAQCFEQIEATGEVRLFKSSHPDYPHGEQSRDMIYIKDLVQIIRFFLEHPDSNGLFNAGSGVAHSFNAVARACFAAMGRKPAITYVEMPPQLQGRYQNFTALDLATLRKLGYHHRPTALDKAIKDYYGNFHAKGQLRLGDTDATRHGTEDALATPAYAAETQPQVHIPGVDILQQPMSMKATRKKK